VSSTDTYVMYRRLTLEQVKQEIALRHGDIVHIVDETYVSISKHASFVDCDYGTWSTGVRSVLMGCTHPHRAFKRVGKLISLSFDEIDDKIKKKHGNIITLDRVTYVNRDIPARFIDVEYGEYWAKPAYVLRGSSRHPLRVKLSCKKRLSVEDIVGRVYEKHGNRISICVETYTHIRAKALFVDSVHGEWWARPDVVIRGAGHPNDSLKKAIATMRSFSTLPHWKTGEVCYPASGFEHAVLVWLNENHYDFDWQVPVQTPMLTPKLQQPVIYNVDCYIKSGPFSNTYIEVKGTWDRRKGNDGGKAKWEWFHSEYPNSQLWMREDLKRLGIIDAQRAYLEKARNK
jgi:hypothetical protein